MKFLITLLILCLPDLAGAQDTTKIKHGALMLSQAMMKGDVETLVAHTYPRALAMTGGKEKVTAEVQKFLKELAAQGMSFRSVEFGNVSKIVKAGTELHCTIPHTISLTVKGGYVSARSSIIGISADQGKTWKYISAGNIPLETLKKVLPNFNPELKIQQQTAPVFHQDKAGTTSN
ncbi:hypothetical protein C7T94_04085 [Pedobacter yulinensis]|uniref:DUF4440 domain-containing protein n=1 Tax=Pedobacter yulinensis TaxID=2126353 RepID=A0A2T3HN98_9SPHI|nr:hypothetical protein [Pedobacter yulinensis]PST83930.1 hypothetical protein C7T94_04085 [Pedobacter yulinensis]